MFKCIKNKAVAIALDQIRQRMINPGLKGIAEARDLCFKDGQISATVILEGLEDRPVDIVCENINVDSDGTGISVGNFESNMPFVQNALKLIEGRKFPVPTGMARAALSTAKKLLNL